MSKEVPKKGIELNEVERKVANKYLIDYMESILKENKDEVFKLQKRLVCTYWVIVILSIVMFIIGIMLLSVPVIAAIKGDISELQSLIAAGFGISNLTALFLFRPVERIHHLMGDMSQITIAINSFQEQVALRLLEANTEDRDTMGKAADHIQMAAKDSIGLIEKYFEKKKKSLKN